MARFVVVKLGGTEYSVPHLNIDQLERVTELFQQTGPGVAFKVLRIAMERATPRVENPGEIEASPTEIKEAVQEILVMSGLKSREGEAEPETAPLA